MIYQTLNQPQFRTAFHNMGRGDQFSYEALNALYDYLDEIGEDYELDVIAVCCDFTEYDSIDSFNSDYGRDCESWDEVREETLVLELENGGAVIQQF